MKYVVIICFFGVLLAAFLFGNNATLLVASSSGDATSIQSGRPPQTRTATRRPTQTRIPTRRPSQTRIPTRKPSHTKTVIRRPSHTKTVTRRPSQTSTPSITRVATQTPMPTTTPSVVPTSTSVPAPLPITESDTVTFVNVGASEWRVSVNSIDAGIEPTLELQKSATYTFTVNAGAFHPLILSTDGTNTNEYTDGVSPVGGSTATLVFTVPADAPSVLYYVCLNHASMRGMLTIVDP